MRRKQLWGMTVVGLGLVGCSHSPHMSESTMHHAPPTGFSALLNGYDLTGWRGLVGGPPKLAGLSPDDLTEAQRAADENMRAHWSVHNGVLHFDGRGASLVTDQAYRDFELTLDWKIDLGGDSGIYLRGSPQVQIWDNINLDFSDRPSLG